MFTILKKDEIKSLSIRGFIDIVDKIDFEPLYQRYGNIWNTGKKQLLLDTIINGFDIPKFYFNYFVKENNILNPNHFVYAIIDGKQRLLAIKEFYNNKLSLSDTFVYYKDDKINLKGLSRQQIALKSPEILNIIDNYILDVVYVITDEEEKIEELFSRLNGGSALNNAEKRNAIGGYLNSQIRLLAEQHPFFLNKLKFNNPRFQHQDLLTKLAFIEFHQKLQTLSNEALNQFVRTHKNENSDSLEIISSVRQKLDMLSYEFFDSDKLLTGKGVVPVYYWFITSKNLYNINIRSYFEYFESFRRTDKTKDPEFRNPELLAFDRLNQQGTHKDKSLIGRFEILEKYFYQWAAIHKKNY